MATPRVLVVEDDRAIRALVAKILERKGCTVEVAEDGGDVDRARFHLLQPGSIAGAMFLQRLQNSLIVVVDGR